MNEQKLWNHQENRTVSASWTRATSATCCSITLITIAGRSGATLPGVRKLYHGLPHVFLQHGFEVSDLTGDHVTRERTWASCFTSDHSYMNFGAVRKSVAAQYRQWLTHKLASWHDQFDTSGCTGCGRCITWCPVAIDLTEEVAAIRE